MRRGLTRRSVAAIAAAALSCVALAGCGGSTSSSAQQRIRDDRLAVRKAQESLTVAVLSATDELGLFSKTQKLARAIRKASSDGAATAWLEKQIDTAETLVETWSCHDCFSLLEAVRS